MTLMTSADLPALASQSAGITGMSPCAWPYIKIYLLSQCLQMMHQESVDMDAEKFVCLEREEDDTLLNKIVHLWLREEPHYKVT